jgi:excinuclease ABC subunit B
MSPTRSRRAAATGRRARTPPSARRSRKQTRDESDHVTVDAVLGRAPIGHNFKATIADLKKRMKEAAGNLEFETAGRLRDEIKRLQPVELALGDDPLARQAAIDAVGGGYAGERPFGRAANMPASRARKPTDADMWAAQLGRRRGAA